MNSMSGVAALTGVKRARRTTPFLAPALFSAAAGVELQGWERVAHRASVTELSVGQTLFHQDGPAANVYVLRSGLIKNVYLDAEGEEWIKSFVGARQVFASVAAMTGEANASFSAIALAPSTVEIVPFSALALMADADTAWARGLWRAMLSLAARKEAREKQLLTLTPEERYQDCVHQMPDMVSLVAQKDLARYLGVTPVGLNRIIRRVKT
jgi:CRP-like cAMP-binding protein